MKKLIAFCLCFTILAVGVTYGCIQYTLRTPAEDQIQEIGIDLNGFYDENDLVIDEVWEELEEATVTYPQISGLKNKDVQDGINAAIRSETERMRNQYAAQGTNLAYLSYNLSGSFGNTLSVGLYSGDDAMHYDQAYLNFNLNDGSLLQLSDLFARDADLQNIIHTAFYDAVTRGNLSNTYWEEVSYPDEQELYRTVKGYLNAETQQFLFTPAEINLYYNDYMATIPMTDYADDIVIYSKYLTEESLFEDETIGFDGVFACARIPGGYERREFGFAAENFWYDIALSEAYLDEQIPADRQLMFHSFQNDMFEMLLSEMYSIRNTALENPDKAYVLLANPSGHMYTDSQQSGDIWLITPSCAAEATENYALYEMSAALFESKYRPALLELYRTGTYTMFYSGLDEYMDGDEVQATHRRSYELYNYETGQMMTVDDIFVEGYDYPTTVRANAKYDLVSYYGYTMEDAELAVETLRYEVSGSGLKMYLPGWGEDQYLYMPLRDFPRVALKIFN